jgi:hypothetical protein
MPFLPFVDALAALGAANASKLEGPRVRERRQW